MLSSAGRCQVLIMNEWEHRMLRAAAEGKMCEVHKLLKKFGSPNVIDQESGQSALCLAVKGGHNGTAKILLETGAKSTPLDKCGLTPLHYAVKDHNADAVKMLVLHGASIDVKTPSGLTPQDLTEYTTEHWKILQDAKQGLKAEYTEVSEVPVIPQHAIENSFRPKVKKKTGKKGDKKAKKKKK